MGRLGDRRRTARCRLACMSYRVRLSAYAFDKVTVITSPPPQSSSTTRSRLLHDKVTSPRLKATSAVIHLCQEKTGIKKRGTEAR